MDNALRRLALLFALALPCHAQGILAPILFGHGGAAPTGTNIGYVGGNGNQVGSNAAVSVSYTCVSTSNELVVWLASTGNTFTLSDTGGKAAGATSIPADTNDEFWIMGCASGSNTITATAGSGGTPNQTILVEEYSGITMAGDGSVQITTNTGTTSCAVSATSSQLGDLSVVIQKFVSANSDNLIRTVYTSPRMWISAGPPNTYGPSAFVWTDNLYAPSGTVNYSATFPSTNNVCYMLLIKGVAATSPGFYPILHQSKTASSVTVTNPTFAFSYAVASGSVIVVDINYNGSTSPTSVTDSLSPGTAYVLENTQQSGTSNEVLQYVGVTTASGSDTITVNGSGWGNRPTVRVSEFTGLTGTTTDHGGQTSGSGTMTWSQPVSNNNSAVIVSCSTNGLTSQAFGISGTGYSLTSATGGLVNTSGGSWAAVSTSGTSTPTMTMGNNSKNVCGGITLQ